ncbi:MAG: hypothetical protein COT16_03545, partial [Elusimicrobia bacterium CG08_land_8_20_14_0_20_44_26]
MHSEGITDNISGNTGINGFITLRFKTFAFVAGLAFFLYGGGFSSAFTPLENAADPRQPHRFKNSLTGFTMSSVSWVLGKIDYTAERSRLVTIENNSAKTLTVRTRSSCDCISVNPGKTEIAPGGDAAIRITFNPLGEKGGVTHSVYIETDDEKNPFINYIITAEVAESFDVYLFYDINCGECVKIISKLEELRGKHNFVLKKFPVSDTRNFEYLRFIEKIYGIASDKFPVFVAGKTVLSGGGEILEKCEKSITSFIPHEAGINDFKDSPPGRGIMSDFGGLKFFPVAAAALIDGVNPCAFAGIIFLVSYMSFIMKRPKKEVLLFGAGYAGGVCVFYFLFGLGLLAAVRALFVVRFFGRFFYFAVAALAASLAVFSVRDVFLFRKSGDIGLKVPDKLREKMKKTAINVLEKKTAFFYFFLIGGLVSSFELVCTGQVYLPTISYIISATNYAPAA